jgi:CheY-like chemotaxis protein
VVSLPILDPSKIENPTPTISQSEVTDPLSGLTVLIVEDEDDSREVLRLHLTNLGANVLYTSSVAQAFATLDSSSVIPDLIISDIGMPDEDGISFIKRLRTSANESWAAIPALALSAFATSEIKANALEAGFQRYLTKPFDPETLMAAVLENIKAKS